MRPLLLLPLTLFLAAAAPSPPQDQGTAGRSRKPPPLSRMPRLLKTVRAPYPPAALKAGREGTVVLQLDVDTRGKVSRAVVLRGAGPEFDRAALQAARQFRFSPGVAGGKPVPVRITYRYRFQIQKTERKVRVVKAPVPTGPRKLSFRGKLRERGNRRPLGGVRVYLLGTGQVARTRADGTFEFRGVDPGKFKLTARTPAHDRLTTTIEIPFKGFGKGTFYLRRRPYDPYETIIRAPRERERAIQRTVRLEEISRIPGIQGDALKVVQNLPGVARLPFSFGGLVVRGSAPQDSLAFLDGHPLPILFHFLGLRSVFNSDILSRIDFIPGNYPAEYGRLSAGLVDVWTRPGKRDGFHGFIDVNLFDSGFLLEGPVGKGSFTLSARRSYIDAILPLVLGDNANIDLTVAPVYYDYQATLSYPLGKGHDLRVMIYGSEDEMKFLRKTIPGSGSADLRGEFRNNIVFHRLHVAWNYRRGDFQHRFSAAGGIDRILIAVFDRFDFVRDQAFVSIRDEAQWRFGPNLRLAVGLDLQTGRERFAGTLPRIPKPGESPRVILDEAVTGEDRVNFFNPALYLSLSWKVTDRLTVTPQLRWDYFSRMAQGVLAPRLTVRYDFTKQTYVQAAAGLYHQQPFFDELSSTFGNPDLGPIRAAQYALSFSHRFTEALSVDLTGFYKYLDNLVVRSENIVTRNGQLSSQLLSNNGRGEVYGLEFLLRQRLFRGFFAWLGYTLMRSHRQNAPDQPFRVSQFDQTHILTLIASYKFGSGWQIGVRWRYTSGFPYTPYIGGIYDADADRYRRIPGPVLSERIPAFHQLDLRVDKEWAFKTWKFSIYLDLQNVYNRENPEAVRYNFNFTQRVFVTGLPIIPAIGFRGEF